MTITCSRNGSPIRPRCILAPNPGPDDAGRHQFLPAVRRRARRRRSWSIPGPDDAGHLAALAAAGPVELILITHRHHDHTEGAPELARLTGAPVRALDPAFCIGGAPLPDGETIDAAGVVDHRAAPPRGTPTTRSASCSPATARPGRC